ncbi:hypothetical protein B4U79_07938, partial [Dinothrombium tinctorium]
MQEFVELDKLFAFPVLELNETVISLKDEQAKDPTIKEIKGKLEKGNNDPKLIKYIVDPDGVVYRQGSVLPQDIVMQNRTLGVDEPNDYFNLIKSWSQIAIESVKQAIESEQNSYTVRTNIKRREPKFKEGDLVLIYTPFRKKGKAEKLLSRFVGPFLLIKQIGPVVFEVEKLTNKKRDLVHVSRMKPYIERN